MAVGRWPLAVGRWPLAVGRWPLAVALVAGGLLMMAPEAHAGGWRVITPPPCVSSSPYAAYMYIAPTAQEKAAWLAQWGEYFSGDITWSAATGNMYRSEGRNVPDVVVNQYTPGGETGTMPFWEFAVNERLGGDDGSGGSHFSKGGIGGEVELKTNDGKMRYKLVWQRATIRNSNGEAVPDPDDNPPDPYIFVHIVAGWHANSGELDFDGNPVFGSTSANVTISLVDDDGDNDDANDTMRALAFDVGHPTGGGTLATTGLDTTIKLPVGSSGEVWTPWFKVAAGCKVATGADGRYGVSERGRSYGDTRTYWRYGGVAQAGTFGVDKLDYHVEISRGIAAKRWNDPTLNKDRDEWVEADGTGHGHTTYSYKWESVLAPAIVRDYTNWQNFHANITGWATGATGAWTVADADDTKTQHKKDMVFGTRKLAADDDVGKPSHWEGDPTGVGAASVTYTITDSGTSSPITGTALYDLTLHDEWELGDEITDSTTGAHVTLYTWEPFPAWTSNPINDPAHRPDKITGKYGITFDTSVSDDYKKSVSTEAKITADAGFDAATPYPLLKAKGVNLGVKGSASLTVATESTMTTANSQKMTYSLAPTQDVYPGDEALPSIPITGSRRKFNLRHWGENGFVSDVTLTVEAYDASPYHPTWRYQPIAPTTPGGGGGTTQ